MSVTKERSRRSADVGTSDLIIEAKLAISNFLQGSCYITTHAHPRIADSPPPLLLRGDSLFMGGVDALLTAYYVVLTYEHIMIP